MIVARRKPAVNKSVLLITAALVWIGAGTMLLSLAYTWLHRSTVHGAGVLAAVGALAALVVHHFGFLKVVDKNLARILPIEGRPCFFAFMSWKSYGLVAVMIGMGFALRHSSLPRPYLAVLYIAIGLALVLSSIRYLRVGLLRLAKQKS